MEGFTIRISGAPPAPAAAPGARKGGGMGGGKKKKPGAAPPAQQQQQRHTLRGLLPTTSASDLTRRVFDAYGVPVASRDGLAVRFLGGFPPRELSAEDEGRDDLDGLGVGPNESLIVRFVPLNGNPGGAAYEAAASKKKPTGDEEKPPAPDGPDEVDAKPAAAARPKRAAAEEASRNFASVIAAQDAMMAGSASPKSKKRGGAAAGVGKKSANNKSGKRAKITGPRDRGATSMQGRGPDFRTCQTVSELADLARRNLDSMSNRDIAAFWSLLPRLLRNRGAQDPNLEEKLRRVINTTCTRMQSFQCRDLSQASLGIAKTISQVSRGYQQYRADDPRRVMRGLFVNESQCSPVFDSIASSAVGMLNEIDARSLSNLIYSFGLVERNPDIGGETLFDVSGKTAVRILQTFKPQELSNMLWAFVKVDAKNSRLFQETGGVISGMDLDSFKPQEQSNILWSFSKSGEANPELFRVLGNHIVARSLNDFQPQHLSNIAWAFATAGVSHPILFKKIRDHIAGQDRLNLFNPQNLSNITWAFATAGDSHPEVFKKIGDHIAGLNSLDSFKAQALSNIAWAYSVANVPSEGLFNECFAGACSSKEETFPEEELRQLHQWQLWQQELKSGMELPHSLKEKCRNAFISSSYSESKLQNDVVDELKAIGLDLEVEVLLESGYRVDALVKFSDGGKLVVEVDGPSHFIERRPTGSTTLKHRQVGKLDRIEVVSVPHWEWKELKNSETKQHYLHEKLGCDKDH